MPQINIPLYAFGLVASSGNLIAAGGRTDDEDLQPNVYKFDLIIFDREQITSMRYKRSSFGLLEMPLYDPNICSMVKFSTN